MISSRIDTFINHFHYLNRKDHRAGCLLFGNKNLTRELENLAKKLREDMLALKGNSNITEDDRGNQFLALVRACFEKVERLRTQHGRPLNTRKHPPYKMLDEHQHPYTSIWVKPRNTGRFEKQLIAGLNAVNREIEEMREDKLIYPDVLKEFQRLCRNLLASIRSYHHPEKALVEQRNQQVKLGK